MTAEQARRLPRQTAREMLQDRGFWDRCAFDVRTLFQMLGDLLRRRYGAFPGWTVTAVLAWLLYAISPIDLIPDFLPVVGFVDDAMMIFASLWLVEKDLVKYLSWKGGTVDMPAASSSAVIIEVEADDEG